MIFSNTQLVVWALIIAVPTYAASRAWLELEAAILGGLEALHYHYNGMFLRPFERVYWRPQLLHVAVFRQPTPERARLQRRFQLRFLFVWTAAVVGWFLAGWVGSFASLNEFGLRSFQVVFFGAGGLWSLRELRRPSATRLWPNAQLVGGVLGGIFGVVFAVLAPLK
jgi:hypothetical protein